MADDHVGKGPSGTCVVAVIVIVVFVAFTPHSVVLLLCKSVPLVAFWFYFDVLDAGCRIIIVNIVI